MVFGRHGHGGGLVSGFLFISAFGRNAIGIGGVHHHRILQSAFFPQNAANGGSEQIHVVFFEPFAEKRAGYLNGQCMGFKFYRFNRGEPSAVMCRITQIVAKNPETIFPYKYMFVFHGNLQKMVRLKKPVDKLSY